MLNLNPTLVMTLTRQLKQLPFLSGKTTLLPLQGGQDSNRWLPVVDNDRRYFLKLIDTDFTPIDRDTPFAIQQQVARQGIAPQALYLQKDDIAFQLDEWVDAPKHSEDAPDAIRLLAEALSTVHGLNIQAPPLPLWEHWQHYLSRVASARRATLLDKMQQYRPQLESMAASVLCHHDLHISHILGTGPVMKIIDWEYAAMGDPAFDVAACIAVNRLDARAGARLCQHYAELRPSDFARLTERVAMMAPLVTLTNALWHQAQQPETRA